MARDVDGPTLDGKPKEKGTGTNMQHERPRGIHLIGVVAAAAALLAGCSGAALSPTTAPTIASTPTAEVTAAPTDSPVPTAAPSPTAGCSVTSDMVPVMNVKFHISGTGFKPKVDVTLKVNDAPVFNGSDSLSHPPGLHSGADGAFGPYEMYYDNTEAPGTDNFVFSDGTCSATYSFVVPAP